MTKSLAARDDFVLFLFTLMTNKKTFLQTATLIEDILGVKKVRVASIKSNYHPKVWVWITHICFLVCSHFGNSEVLFFRI